MRLSMKSVLFLLLAVGFVVLMLQVLQALQPKLNEVEPVGYVEYDYGSYSFKLSDAWKKQSDTEYVYRNQAVVDSMESVYGDSSTDLWLYIAEYPTLSEFASSISDPSSQLSERLVDGKAATTYFSGIAGTNRVLATLVQGSNGRFYLVQFSTQAPGMYSVQESESAAVISSLAFK